MTLNCLIVDDDEFSREIVKNCVSKTENLQLVGECETAVKAVNFLKDHEVDIIFLDVEMPEMSGIELVKSMDSLPQVILITARSNYAVEAFEYSVTDYIVKPIDYPRFLKAVQKAEKNMQSPVMDSLNTNNIYVKSDNKIIKVGLDEILFVEALSDYVIINTLEKRHIVHSTMKGIEKRLPASKFIRVHRSYIINIDKIQSIEDLTISMPKKSIPIGASYKNAFLARLNFI